MDWEEIETACIAVQKACDDALDAWLNGEFDACDVMVLMEEGERAGCEVYDTDDLMDVCELVSLESLDGVDYDTIPATLERCIQEGF